MYLNLHYLDAALEQVTELRRIVERRPPAGVVDLKQYEQLQKGIEQTFKAWSAEVNARRSSYVLRAERLDPIRKYMAAVAERFLGAPYLWGGRESLGLDCSGLVQQALFACGRACPRDADQQSALGQAIGRDEVARGDLICWNGHIAIGLDETRIVHANGHHMAVAIEPLEDAIRRIDAAGVGQPTAYRRP